MCDDAFTHVCDLLNDVSMPVRALAAGLLGEFHSVSPELLDQTLDKKLMSHLKVLSVPATCVSSRVPAVPIADLYLKSDQRRLRTFNNCVTCPISLHIRPRNPAESALCCAKARA